MFGHSAYYEVYGTYMLILVLPCVSTTTPVMASRGIRRGGWIFSKSGYQNLMDDMDRFRRTVQVDYPAIPYFIMGHSMDSFLTR